MSSSVVGLDLQVLRGRLWISMMVSMSEEKAKEGRMEADHLPVGVNLTGKEEAGQTFFEYNSYLWNYILFLFVLFLHSTVSNV